MTISAPITEELAAGFRPDVFCRRAAFVAGIAAVAMSVCVALPVSFTESMLIVSCTAAVLSFRWWRLGPGLLRNPAVHVAVLLLGVLFLGATYTTVPWSGAFRTIGKFRDLFFLIVLLTVFQSGPWRRYCTYGLIAAGLLLAGASWLEFATGWDIGLESVPDEVTGRLDHVTFKDRIIHNLIVGFSIYLLAVEWVTTPKRWWLYLPALLLTVGSAVFLVQGRTGYVVGGALLILFLYQQLGRRGLVAALVALAVCSVVGYAAVPTIRGRVNVTIQQFTNHFGETRKRSPDQRLEFYENSLQIWSHRPLWGWGTGSFGREYRLHAKDKGLRPADDPHCEYLLWLVQGGCVAAAALVLSLIGLFVGSRALPEPERRFGSAAVLMFMVGCLFNSLLFSATGGQLFAICVAMAWSQHPSMLAGSQDSAGDAAAQQQAMVDMDAALADAHNAPRARER